MASHAGNLTKNPTDSAVEPDLRSDVRFVRADDNIWLRLARYSLYIAIFFSCWTLLRPGEANFTLSDFAVGVAVLIFFARGQLRALPFGWMTPFWLIGLILMLGGLLFSTLINGDVTRWLIVAGQYLFAFLLIPMVLMGQDVRFTRRLPLIYIAGTVVSQVIGIASSFIWTYADTAAVFGDGFITGNGRIGAMTGEPNPNAAVIAISLAMLIYCIRTRRIPILLAILCAIPLVWGLLASGSFTGFGAAIVAVSIMMAISGIRVFLKVGLVAAVASTIFFASGAPLPTVFEERVATALSSGDINQAGSYTGRAALVRDAWENADDTIIVGVGVDRFREVSQFGAPVHELHLLIWNEGGLMAFLGLLMLIAALIVFALRAVSRNREEGGMILAVVAVFMIYTFSIPHMYSRQWVMPVMLALSTFYAMRPKPPVVSVHRRHQ